MSRKKGSPRRIKVFPIRVVISALFFFLELAVIVIFVYLSFVEELVSQYWWVAIAILLVFNFFLAIFVLNTKVQEDFKSSWLAVIAMFPIFGCLIYILFANKLTTNRKKKYRFNPINQLLLNTRRESNETLDEISKNDINVGKTYQYVYSNCLNGVYKDSEVTYFNYGQNGFPIMIEELKKAKKFIFIEYFIIEDGEIFKKIYEILKEKVKTGVDARLIYDDFGSVKTISSSFFKKARKDGIKCFAFNKVRPFMDIRQNCRDHRKILVIDGVVGFTGGCNLADEYANLKVRFGNWRDNIVMVKGKGVEGLTSVFLSSWVLNDRKDKEKVKENYKDFMFDSNSYLLEKNIKTSGFVASFGEIPFDGEDRAKAIILSLISCAKKSIKISTPYLIPDSEIIEALCLASKSGIDVSIVTPKIPDKKIVNSVTKSHYSVLIHSGIKIYEYKPGFNHAKIYLIDDELCMTGTVNLDYRSLYLHFENAILLYKCDCLKDIVSDMDSMISLSEKIVDKKYINPRLYRRIYWSLLRLFAPLL